MNTSLSFSSRVIIQVTAIEVVRICLHQHTLIKMLTYEPSYILKKSNSGNISREKFTYKLHEFLKFGLGNLMAIS